jgi:hypothetical protein
VVHTGGLSIMELTLSGVAVRAALSVMQTVLLQDLEACRA